MRTILPSKSERRGGTCRFDKNVEQLKKFIHFDELCHQMLTKTGGFKEPSGAYSSITFIYFIRLITLSSSPGTYNAFYVSTNASLSATELSLSQALALLDTCTLLLAKVLQCSVFLQVQVLLV